MRVCLACRNLQKAESARQSLLASCPGSKVDILQLDVSSISSVQEAAAELQRRCGPYLYPWQPHVHALHAIEAEIFNAILSTFNWNQNCFVNRSSSYFLCVFYI